MNEEMKTMRSAFPLFLSLSMVSLISLAEITLSGCLGSNSQAALGIADQIIFLNMLVMTGFCAAVNSLISQSFGARELARAQLQMKYSLIVSAVIGTVATVIGLMTADVVASVFTSNPAVRSQAAMFIRLCAYGNLPWALAMCQGAIFRASGNAGLCVWQWLIITTLCIGGELIAFFCIPGCRSIAPLGISWDVAITFGVIAGCRSLRLLIPGKLTFSWIDLNEHGHKLLAVGIPVMVADMCWLLSNLTLFSLLSILPNPTTGQAAWTLHLKIEEAVAYVPLMAWCQATATSVGNRCGAKDHRSARRIASRMAKIAVLVMFLVGCLTAAMAPLTVQIASHDAAVRRLAEQLLFGSIITFPINAVTLVLAAAMEGAGCTLSPMVVNIVGLFVVRLPLAWLLAVPCALQIAGVWIAKAASNAVTLTGMLWVSSRLSRRSANPEDADRSGSAALAAALLRIGRKFVAQN
ncbi:MAG TPA: MATE family efflux transporter [Trichormus sp.]|jgi:Na+-driven multidrug efflux pump